MKYEHELEIGRSPEDVYSFLADLENLPKWQQDVLEVRRQTPSRFTEVRTFMGRRVESTLDVTAAQPGRQLALRSAAGPVRFSIDHLLEPVGEGKTRLRVLGESEGAGGIFKIGGRLLRRAVERRAREDFARLKELLEA